jgi:type II secretory ATPase GspE/PulE/Tfp pilus assembly ATPase PilB-like protein
MANAILVSGIEAGASDISLESDRTHVRVRIRVDGTLQELLAIPNYVETALINRYLVMAELNPSTRRPQQGVFSVLHGETHLNLRVSYLPILRGSKLAMRLYDCTNLPSVWDLGMSEDIGSEIGSVATYENGLILFVGSPGEGATTTAFAFLKGLNTPERYLCTLEEQMSYSVEGLSQIYWKPQNNLTPQTILPTLLRQDPDILFVGDIDTAENLEFALQVAEQGITVIATLHAPDSVHALFRLMRLGVSSERLQSVLRCICAQRLVRKICPNCKTAVTVETGEITYKGVGCATCQNRGYKGRTAVFEILWMNRVIGEALSLSSSYLTIQEIALANRLRPFQTTIREMIGEGTIAYEEGIAVSYG